MDDKDTYLNIEGKDKEALDALSKIYGNDHHFFVLHLDPPDDEGSRSMHSFADFDPETVVEALLMVVPILASSPDLRTEGEIK